MILKAFKYRIYPNTEQRILIAKHLGCVRFIFNWGLNKKNKHYEKFKDHEDKKKKSLSRYELQKELPSMKKGEYEWLAEVNSQCLISALANLDLAFTNFFRRCKTGEIPGFPKFKSRFSNIQSFQSSQRNSLDAKNKLLSVPNIPNIPIILHRRFAGKLKTTTISKTSSGKYFASLCVETKGKLPKKPKLVKKMKQINPKNLNQQFLNKNLKRIKIFQKRLKRKQ